MASARAPKHARSGSPPPYKSTVEVLLPTTSAKSPKRVPPGSPPPYKTPSPSPIPLPLSPVHPLCGWARSTTVWKADGNVQLIADGTGFRVHRTVLTENSTFFARLSALERAPGVEDVIVHVREPSAWWEHLLRAVYERQYFAPSRAHPFETVAAVARLSYRYGFGALRVDALTLLTHEWPCTLAAHDAHAPGSAVIRTAGPDGSVTTDAAVVQLARELCLPELLPLALYHLALGDASASTELISADDHAVAYGRAALVRARRQLVDTWLRDGACAGCAPLKACLEDARATSARDASAALEPWDVAALGLCALCAERAFRARRTGRQRVWDELPVYFGLPPWDKISQATDERRWGKHRSSAPGNNSDSGLVQRNELQS